MITCELFWNSKQVLKLSIESTKFHFFIFFFIYTCVHFLWPLNKQLNIKMIFLLLLFLFLYRYCVKVWMCAILILLLILPVWWRKFSRVRCNISWENVLPCWVNSHRRKGGGGDRSGVKKKNNCVVLVSPTYPRLCFNPWPYWVIFFTTSIRFFWVTLVNSDDLLQLLGAVRRP